MEYLDNNTTSMKHTHFLRGSDLIKRSRKLFNVCSENWPSPIKHFGSPGDNYYAEIWLDGMDWQPSYWIIEAINYSDPFAVPFIIFDKNEVREKFNDYDFDEVCQGMMWFRRETQWIKSGDYGRFLDTVWPYMTIDLTIKKHNDMMIGASFAHASQEKVSFLINQNFVAPRKIYAKL